MRNPCNDCQASCSQIHLDYDPLSCKISNGDPCQQSCQMAVLDDRISQVHAELVALAHKRRFLKMRINHRHELFIHRLPLEISSKIFTTYVDDIDSAFHPKYAKSLEQRSPALHLSSICTAWRSVARCTAQIWKVIRVPLLRNPVNVQLLTELVTQLFSLSGQRPLSLTVHHNYREDSGHPFDDSALFRAYIRRLRSLDDLLLTTRAVTSRCTEISLMVWRSNNYRTFSWTRMPQTSKKSEFSHHMDNLKKATVGINFHLALFLCLRALS